MTETAGYVTALDWRDSRRGARHGDRHAAARRRAPHRRRATAAAAPPARSARCACAARACSAATTSSRRDRARCATASSAPATSGCIDAAGAFHFTGPQQGPAARQRHQRLAGRGRGGAGRASRRSMPRYVVGPAARRPRAGGRRAHRHPRRSPLPEAELRALAAAALSPYKRPSRYLRIGRDEVPLGGTAKPQRAALAALAAARLARD